MVGPDPIPLGQLRAEVMGTEGVVAASSPTIALAGARVLADGGNAVDATLAMAAVSWMVLPGQCGLGGDAFAIVREPDGRVWTVNGSGAGPDGGTPNFYRDRGLDALPVGGPLAVAVPGAPAALHTLGVRASRPLEDLWQPAVRMAREGLPCTAKNRNDIAQHRDSIARDPDMAEVFLPAGRLPSLGQRIAQPALADWVARLAADPMIFYTGEFADRALSTLRDGGAPFTGEEWRAAQNAPEAPAICTQYGDSVLHQTPLPSAGWMMLQQAAICDGMLAGLEQLGAEAVHWFAEAAGRAFRDRFDHCSSSNDLWRNGLSPAAVERARAGIGQRVARSHDLVVAPDGDTTSTVCVDTDGRAVSFIHSLAFTFGSRITVPGTGIVLNNRLGRGAYLIDGHPNEVQPRRKPLHTLNAWLTDGPEGLRHVGSCPGGDGQVQWNMQVLSHLTDHGNDPQRAVSLPRVTVFPGSDANVVVGAPPVLRCEPGLPPGTTDRLREWGHTVEELPAQRGGPGGSALAVTLDHEQGVLRVGADPRMEGTALAL